MTTVLDEIPDRVRPWHRIALAADLWRAERDPAGLRARQERRLDALVAHARARSRYYAELYAPLGPGRPPLERLPVVRKPELMARFDDWVTDPAVTRAGVEAFVADPDAVGRPYLGSYLVFTTSGTTGEPAVLLQDEPALAVLGGIATVRVAPRLLDRHTLAAVVRGGGRSASVWAEGRPFGGASLLRRQVLRRPSRATRLRLFSALTPTDELVAQLDAFAPVMLSGYASALALLAREQRAGRLHIRPAVVNNGGETLTDDARHLIGTAFGARVSNGYGCSEMVMIAGDCRHGALHVNADRLVLEPVDERMRPVPVGEPSSTVLLTNLANRVQPIIRYDLGDSVRVLPGRCACGSALPVVEVVGRTNDVLRLGTGAGPAGEVLPLPLVTLAEGVAGVRCVQLLQVGPDVLAVRLDLEPGHDREPVHRAVASRLREHLARHGLPGVEVVADADPPRREPGSGKLRQVLVRAPVPGAGG